MAFNPLDAFDPSQNIATAQSAGQKVQRSLRKGRGYIKGGKKQSVKAIETKGYEVPRADITTSLGQTLPTIQGGAEAGQGYYGQGLGYIDTATGQQVGALQGAQDLWSPIRDIGMQGIQNYGKFYGMGGPQGYQEAQALWQGSPQYQAYSGQNDLLMQQLARQTAQTGNRYNWADIQKYGGQLAGSELGKFISGYDPYFGLATTATGAEADLARALAGVYGTAGTQKAGIAGQQADLAFREALARAGMQQTAGQNLADISRGAAGNLSNIYQNTATQLAGNAAQQGQAAYQTGADINAARNTAAQNQWNAILGIGNAAAKVGAAAAAPVPV